MLDRRMVLFSGGLDSLATVLKACQFQDANHVEVHLVTFEYGQRNLTELVHAGNLGALLSRQFSCIRRHHAVRNHFYDGVLEAGHAFLKGEHTGPLLNAPDRAGNSRAFLPGRNLIFAMLAAAKLYELGGGSVWIGITGDALMSPGKELWSPDDHAGCFQALEMAVRQGGGLPDFRIRAPLEAMSKQEIIQYILGVPNGAHLLAASYTCLSGTEKPCGQCGACLTRASAFEALGRPDPARMEC